MKQKSRTVANNKKAFFDYNILKTIEAGIVLTGAEIKSIRAGKMNLKNSYVDIKNGEAFLVGCHIPEYEKGNRYNHEPEREKKLLLHKREIIQLFSQVKQDGLTIVPLKAYFNNGRIKVEIGLAKGKKKWDKREDLAKKDAKRKIEQAVSNKY